MRRAWWRPCLVEVELKVIPRMVLWEECPGPLDVAHTLKIDLTDHVDLIILVI